MPSPYYPFMSLKEANKQIIIITPNLRLKQCLWPDSEQILRHQYEISVAESLACSRLRDSRARWIEKIKREEAAPPTFRVPFTVASSPLSENLERGWVADVPPRETRLRGDERGGTSVFAVILFVLVFPLWFLNGQCREDSKIYKMSASPQQQTVWCRTSQL